MIALYRKEIGSFFSSIIGYLVIGVFLCLLGLFLWVFPDSGFNIIESGYANLDGLFILAPWVFLFLVPAITMRLISEEQRTGTIEILTTKPLKDWEIIWAKYFAAVTLVLFSLLPSLLYFFSVYQMGFPKGNLDIAGIMGSYLGLLFLACGFVSIGLFASSLSQNQIVAFIIAVFLCFFVYLGFDFMAGLSANSNFNLLIGSFGINQHYASMSRGVIDTRDVVYFFSLVFVFNYLSITKLESRKW